MWLPNNSNLIWKMKNEAKLNSSTKDYFYINKLISTGADLVLPDNEKQN